MGKKVEDIALKDIRDYLPIDANSSNSIVFGSYLFNKEQRKLNRQLGLHKINKKK